MGLNSSLSARSQFSSSWPAWQPPSFQSWNARSETSSCDGLAGADSVAGFAVVRCSACWGRAAISVFFFVAMDRYQADRRRARKHSPRERLGTAPPAQVRLPSGVA